MNRITITFKEACTFFHNEVNIKYLPEVPFSENKTRRVSKLGYARGGHGFGEGGRGRGRERGRCHGRTG